MTNCFEFRAALEAVKMSQADFASLLKVERSTVWRWFSGEREVPHHAMVILSALAGAGPAELRSGRLRQFNVQRRHVYLNGETFMTRLGSPVAPNHPKIPVLSKDYAGMVKD